jgi:hypothetical protein
MNTMRGAVAGNYAYYGNREDADCVIGFSFGTNTNPEGVNAQLASQAMSYGQGPWKPVMMERMLVNSLYPYGPQPAYSIEGSISNARSSEGLGTWGVLKIAHKIMKERKLERPLIVAHAFLADRVATQANKQGMQSIVVPEGLPRQFDRDSEQVWTRSCLLWIPREVIGLRVLRKRGQL